MMAPALTSRVHSGRVGRYSVAKRRVIKSVRARSAVAAALVGLLLFAQANCGDAPKPKKTTKEDLASTPMPPNGWYPFHKNPVEGQDVLKAAAYADKVPLQAADTACGTKVDTFDIHMTGKVRGSLKFNTQPRGSYAVPETNDNTDLGGFNTGATAAFKYEVEITWIGPLKDAIYGQMILTEPVALDSKGTSVEFHDDTPANDWVDKEWKIPEGETDIQGPKSQNFWTTG